MGEFKPEVGNKNKFISSPENKFQEFQSKIRDLARSFYEKYAKYAEYTRPVYMSELGKTDFPGKAQVLESLVKKMAEEYKNIVLELKRFKTEFPKDIIEFNELERIRYIIDDNIETSRRNNDGGFFNKYMPQEGEYDMLGPDENTINSITSKIDASKIMKVVSNLDIAPNEIAYNISELNENTKVYIGEWNPEIMRKIPDTVEYLYESFPEDKIFRKTIEITTKTSEEYTNNLEKEKILISDGAQDMLNKLEPLKQNESINLVSFSVKQLTNTDQNSVTLREIYNKAKEFGLKLCPPQVGPELRLNYKDQPDIEELFIAMKPIIAEYKFNRGSLIISNSNPSLFKVSRNHNSGSWLWNEDGSPNDYQSSTDNFVFSFSKDVQNKEQINIDTQVNEK